MSATNQHGTGMGFACLWEPDPTQTWSHIPWNLLGALRVESETDVVDLGPHLSRPTRVALRAAATRRRSGTWVSPWKHRSLTDAVTGAAIRRALERQPCDVILEIHDLAALDRPYFVFQDLSYQVLLDLWEEGSALQISGLDVEQVRRRRDRQQEIYDRASGVLAMSAWFARHLVERSGVAPERVHIAYAGISARPRPRSTHAGSRSPSRLLFVGRDFERKGGPLLVEATGRLRAGGDQPIQLTIVGPETLPNHVLELPWIDFRGPLGHDAVSECFREADAFVMPSYFEAFGIVFVEALAHGVPVVARDAFAMPEVVEPGHNGRLVATNDPDDWASAIKSVLDDDEMSARVDGEAAEVAERFSWTSTARAVLEAVRSTTPGLG